MSSRDATVGIMAPNQSAHMMDRNHPFQTFFTIQQTGRRNELAGIVKQTECVGDYLCVL